MLKIYDSLTGKKRDFHKKPGEDVGIYVCGPTVYDRGHLGHGRSAVAFDLVRRTLEFLGYNVTFVYNTTDIDDKMIKRAAEEGISVKELAEKITPLYEMDFKALGITPPTHNPKATDYIQEMIAIIQTLEEKGHCYRLEDGIYFDIRTFKNYGKLSHQKLDELNAGARVQERKDKRNHQDFVLWKFKKEGEPSWDSPWGEGRPGWHIECSAMNGKLLGNPFDIHGGGLDLKFPHHECEIAQSEAASGKKMAEFWMHNGYITINEEKMSKSLNNFFTLEDIFKQYHPRVVRFFLISTHYRSPIEFNPELLEQARQTLKSLDDMYLQSKDGDLNQDLLQKFTEKIQNDFDIAGGLATLFEWTKKGTNSKATLNEINKVLNIFPLDFKLSSEQEKKITEREEARRNKDWAKADEIRDELAKDGIELEDSADGTIAKEKI